MEDKRLTIHIDQSWIENFNQQQMKLCVAFGVNGSFNVVAVSADAKPTIRINWQNVFQIAASNDSFTPGARCSASTTITKINYGQAYRLAKDWTDRTPFGDRDAPMDGFLFKNEIEAAPILYKNIQGGPTAIYFSAEGRLPPGARSLRPKATFKVWFGPAQAGTMVSDQDQQSALLYDMTGQPDVSLRYDSSGIWSTI